ncbi:MAG: M15 family metallopeptidase [Micavibrio sp.]
MNQAELRRLDPADLIPMDLCLADCPLRIDVMYAGAGSFCGAVYRKDARLSLHRDMALIILVAGRFLYQETGFRLELYDGLRTHTAQKLICETPIVKAHPHWTADGPLRMFAPPGQGGHPRGMAIDLSIRDQAGQLLDMGTIVDALPEGGMEPEVNPAHREYPYLVPSVQKNRALLTDVLLKAAGMIGLPLWPLTVEWWDYRFPAEIYNLYAPLGDEDVPPSLRLTDIFAADQGVAEMPAGFYEDKAAALAREAGKYVR